MCCVICSIKQLLDYLKSLFEHSDSSLKIKEIMQNKYES